MLVAIPTIAVVCAIAMVILVITIIGIPIAILLAIAMVFALIATVLAIILGTFPGLPERCDVPGPRLLARRSPGAAITPLRGIIVGALVILGLKALGSILASDRRGLRDADRHRARNHGGRLAPGLHDRGTRRDDPDPFRQGPSRRVPGGLARAAPSAQGWYAPPPPPSPAPLRSLHPRRHFGRALGNVVDPAGVTAALRGAKA